HSDLLYYRGNRKRGLLNSRGIWEMMIGPIGQPAGIELATQCPPASKSQLSSKSQATKQRAELFRFSRETEQTYLDTSVKKRHVQFFLSYYLPFPGNLADLVHILVGQLSISTKNIRNQPNFRGRDGDHSPPPARIRTYRFPISGSCRRSTAEA